MKRKKLYIILPIIILIIVLIAIVALLYKTPSKTGTKAKVKPIIAKSITEPRLVIQSGHTDDVYAFALSKDGKLMASGGGEYDSTIKLWNTEQGMELRSLEGHKEDIGALAFSPDRKILASGSRDETIKLWNVETGKLIKSFESLDDGVISMVFSPNGKVLLSGSWNANIRLWDVESGQLIRTIEGNDDMGDLSISITFSADGKYMAGCNDGTTIKIWDFESGNLLKTLEGHSEIALSIAFSPDGKNLVSSSEDKTIKIWDFESGTVVKTIEGHSDVVQSVVYSPDGSKIASASWDDNVKLWDAKSGQLLQTFAGHTDNVGIASFTPDGKKIISTGLDRTIKIWDVENGALLQNHTPHTEFIRSVEFSPDGKWFFTNSWDHNFKLWSAETGQLLHTFKEIEDIIAFSPNRDILVTTKRTETYSQEREINLVSIISGQIIQTFKVNSDIGSSAFSPNGEILAIGTTDDKPISLLSIKSNQIIKLLETKEIEKNNQTSSTNNSNTGFQTNERRTSFIYSIAFSPDGKLLASSNGSEIKIWDFESGKNLQTITNKNNYTPQVTFTSDGKNIVSGSFDSPTIQFWNVETGQIAKSIDRKNSTNKEEIALLKAYRFDKSITPDGRFQIKTGDYGKPNLFDLKTGKLIASVTSIDENDWAVVTPDGRFDTNKLDNPQGLHWILDDAPFEPLSFEVFMKQFYEPKLLARLMNCTIEENCQKEFKPVPSLSELNLSQPEVKITDIKPDSENTLQVTVEVGSTKSKIQKDVNGNTVESGVFDVRLFRNGQLVGYFPKREENHFNQSTWGKIKSLFIKAEKVSGSSSNPNEVILDENGKAVLKFSNIKIMQNGTSTLDFSAYAFNFDQIKSQTARMSYEIEPKTIKGRAYIISLGVNAIIDRPSLNLRYAVNDARQTQEILPKRLSEQNQFEEIIDIPLISDYISSPAGQINITENTATKAHFKAVLDVLAGKQGDTELLKTVKNADKLRQANPEDLVIISVSSHGGNYNGVFYIVPSDVGSSSKDSEDFRQRSISSDDLSLWLRDVDAGELTLIVDACHSTSAVENSEFKPAPMNSRGLGQLSYDKGMKILTATQADNLAWERDNLRQGLLSYALLQEGLNDFQADFKPKDSLIFMSEWLNYGVGRVPQLFESENLGKGKFIRETNDTAENKSQKETLKIQQPSLFDFSRGNKDLTIDRR